MKKKILIDHIIPSGCACETANFFKKFDWKICSYPFDWIFSNPKMITDCIEDKFNRFLDLKYIKSLGSTSQHLYYTHLLQHGFPIFNHYDISLRENHDYYKRCVTRFQNTLNEVESAKLFVVWFRNLENLVCKKKEIFHLYDVLKMRTTNVNILSINHILSTKEYSYEFDFEHSSGRVCFLDFYAESKIYGWSKVFEDSTYDRTLYNIISSIYSLRRFNK